MRRRSRADRRLVLGLALLLTGCAAPLPTPLPPSAPVPTLRGTWIGTWGGTPLTLVVIEQEEFDAYSGLYLGPLQLLGRRVPGVSGVMTSTIGANPVSVSVQGWLGSTGSGLALVLTARTMYGFQSLTLTLVETERLAGMGESDFPWGPRGVVALIHQPTEGRSD